MRWLAGSAVLLAAAAALVLFAWPKKGSGPEPIAYGRDVCHHCRMHITRPGFGGELRDAAGKLTKYDDIGCMIRSMHWAHREFPEAWVEDHGGAGFVSLLSATLVRGEGLSTPMGYGVLAFKEAPAAAAFAGKHGAEVVPLEILLKDRERFEAGAAGRLPADREVHR